VLVLLGKFVALQELAARSEPLALAGVLATALFIARCSTLVMAGLAPYARPEGTGKLVIEAATWRGAVAAGSFILGVSLVADLLVASVAALSAAGVVLLTAVLLTWLCRRRLGGVTGDCLGAVVELAELMFLLTYALIPIAT
jgi:adenosylcobinamide-GDP ribazoletransferase